jgi:hypothetical protein
LLQRIIFLNNFSKGSTVDWFRHGVFIELEKMPSLNPIYERKIAEGHAGMSVLNALKNKIIKRIFACVRGDRLYMKEKEVSKLVN